MTSKDTAVPMHRVATASFAGTTIEFYDFFIYGTAAALVFAPVFFPALGTAAGTVAAFATFGVAFFFRPVGSILFGHFGDRLGRKRTLVATLLLMGLSTFAIGLLPSAEMIGVLAPVVLVVLRALQGLAVGGEWAGAALLTTEYAPAHKRGLYSMFPQLGPGIALALSSMTFLVTTLTLSPEAFREWGWRLPFLISILLVAVGLYIRLKVDETPVFRRVESRNEQVRLPFVTALRHQWREVLLTGGTLTMIFAFFYIGSVYLMSYASSAPGHGVLGLSRPTVLVGALIGALVFAGTCVLSALWSDRHGRRRVILVGNVLAVVAGPLAFAIMQPGNAVSFVIGMVLLMVVVGIPYGPAAAYLPEIFAARYRYTGAGMGYNLAGIVGGAIPLIVAPPLTAAFGGIGVGIYLAALGLLSVLCVLVLPETKDEVLDGTVPASAPA
ncbi:MFS transporter [Pseudonocardia sp. CA-142604]|uniref:MFS transporter n=1 Tax=Pseudonocardia sp. CA-142604 TaxID=3240024 RepID=UPI003D8B6E0C